LSVGIAALQAAACTLSAGGSAIMAHQAPRMTIINLPTGVLSCVLRQLQEAAWQRDQKPEDVAALRSVCRSLHAAVDASVTHLTFHANADAAELHSTVNRCTGDSICARRLAAIPQSVLRLQQAYFAISMRGEAAADRSSS
jgi:hypothetical protein